MYLEYLNRVFRVFRIIILGSGEGGARAWVCQSARWGWGVGTGQRTGGSQGFTGRPRTPTFTQHVSYGRRIIFCIEPVLHTPCIPVSINGDAKGCSIIYAEHFPPTLALTGIQRRHSDDVVRVSRCPVAPSRASGQTVQPQISLVDCYDLMCLLICFISFMCVICCC